MPSHATSFVRDDGSTVEVAGNVVFESWDLPPRFDDLDVRDADGQEVELTDVEIERLEASIDRDVD